MRFSIERDIHIDAIPQKVYELISDLKRWPEWSPWTVGRNDIVQFSWSADGKEFYWDDNIVGSGSIRKIKESPTEIHFDLLFKKPTEASASASLTIKKLAKNRCHVSWQMESKLPWFMFFYIANIKGVISLDFWNGLNMLKSLAQDNRIDAQYSDASFEDFEVQYVVGELTKNCPMYAIGASQPDFEKLSSTIQTFGNHSCAINAYHNFSIKKQALDITAGYVVDEETFHEMKRAIPSTYDYLVIEKGRAAKVTYTGPYRFIGNAWSVAGRFLRYKKQKHHPSLSGFELYRTSPATETDEKKYKTDIFVAIKTA